MAEWTSWTDLNGHGHEFGHASDTDSDTRFFWTSDAESDTDMDKVMTSDTGMSENLGHGHGQTSDTRVCSSLIRFLNKKLFKDV